MHLLCWDALSVIAFQWEVLLSPQPRAGHTAQCVGDTGCCGTLISSSWTCLLLIFYDILTSLNQNLRWAPVQGFDTFLLRLRAVMGIIAQCHWGG